MEELSVPRDDSCVVVTFEVETEDLELLCPPLDDELLALQRRLTARYRS